jgi:pectin methylesterase-like acyl-CoA thioesterase
MAPMVPGCTAFYAASYRRHPPSSAFAAAQLRLRLAYYWAEWGPGPATAPANQFKYLLSASLEGDFAAIAVAEL